MKYTKADITKVRCKYNSGVYSATWYRKHFKDMLDHIEKLNQKEEQDEIKMETRKQSK